MKFQHSTIKTSSLYIFLLITITIIVMSCKDDEGGGNGMTGEPACDETLRPIVFVHGFLASGDTYELQLQRFSSNAYCSENLFAFDWNSLDFGGDATAELDAFIDDVLLMTGFDKVNLAGHSAGSGTGYNYLATEERAAKVANYVHLAGSPTSGPAGPNGEIPTLNIWSTADLVVAGGDIPGASNVMQTDKDHYEVATSEETFSSMYSFFNSTTPSTTDIREQETIEVSGKVLSFGENAAFDNATINVYALDANTGLRLESSPEASTTSSIDGSYGNITLRPDVYYEFETIPNNGGRTVKYYREPFVRSNELVYLRMIPSGGIGSLLLGALPEDDAETVFAFYSGSRAVINGRDELVVDGNTLSTTAFAAAENSTIAMFFYDGNDNQTTDLTDIGGTWALVPTFLAAVDIFTPTTPELSIDLNLNGRKITIPNAKSESDGVIVAQFN